MKRLPLRSLVYCGLAVGTLLLLDGCGPKAEDKAPVPPPPGGTVSAPQNAPVRAPGLAPLK